MGACLYGANIQANGIRQHYLRYGGKGQPLLLIPGITSPAITWGFVAEALAERFDVHVLDVRGRGLSETGPHLAYDLDSYAADAAAVIAGLELKECIVLGHSMGARIALRLGHNAPANIARMVLVDPPVSGPGRREYPAKLPWYVESIRQSLKGMSAEEMRAFCPTWTQEQLQLRAEWLHTCDEAAVVETFERFHTEDVHQDVPHIPCLALLMVAMRGGVILPEDEEELKSLSGQITVAHVPDAGHMIPWDNFDGFIQTVMNFMRPAG
ncbi:alpha/beta fold hydrolase [Acidocella sp.]|uniref:alpha/beta fold hydrolase n=1 Tax=Acidocella sp. TaxID=50710 RepID=UPI003CFC17EC